MMRQLGYEIDVGNGLVEDDAIDRLHVLVHELEQGLQALGRRPCLIERDNHTHGLNLSISASLLYRLSPCIFSGTLPHKSAEMGKDKRSCAS